MLQFFLIIYLVLEFFGNLFSNIRYIYKLPKIIWYPLLIGSLLFFYFLSYFTNVFVSFASSFLFYTLLNYHGNYVPKKKLSSQENKIGIITGISEGGIGFHLAKTFLELKGTLIFACRNVKNTETLVEKLKKETKNDKVYVFELDMASFESIKAFSKKIKSKFDKIDVLINNAGLFSNPGDMSSDGFELCTQVNYLSIYALTIELLDLLKKSKSGRIVGTSSSAQEPAQFILDDFKGEVVNGTFISYERSKLFLNMFTRELQERLDRENFPNVTCHSFHPGV
jgi:NAD(P)-dependent dehydrogenase (short-subunit alcohol dehydrogenase family)